MSSHKSNGSISSKQSTTPKDSRCSLSQLDLTVGLQRIARFLHDNLHKVVTLIFEDIPLDGDELLKTQLEAALNMSGLSPLLFVPLDAATASSTVLIQPISSPSSTSS